MDRRHLFTVLVMVALATLGTVRAQCVGTYVVKKGDTLFNIGQSMGVTVDAIVAANPQITDPDLIFQGASLTIPCSTPSAPSAPAAGGSCAGGSVGDATFYWVGGDQDTDSSTVGGFTACGEKFSNRDYVAALAFEDFDDSTPNPNNSPTCKRCAQVCGPAGTAIVRLKDKCEACKSGDIDLSPTAFLDVVGDLDIGRQPGVTWNYVNC